MNDKDSKILERISNTLDEVLAVLKKPENRFRRILDIVAAVITVFGILNIAEIVIKWLTGGN
jgi:hypothetical protein